MQVEETENEGKKRPDFKTYSRRQNSLVLCSSMDYFFMYGPNLIANQILEPFYEQYPTLIQNLFHAGVILISLFLLFLFERWFSLEYEGSTRSDGFGYGMRMILPIVIMILVWKGFKILIGYEKLYWNGLSVFLQGMRPGINEEAGFRGVAVALALRKYRNSKNIWLPTVFIGIAFGLTHFIGFGPDDSFLPVLVNALFAVFFGIIFGAIFTLSGNIWPCMILHSLYDTLAFMITSTEGSPDWPVFAEVGVFLVVMVIFLLLLHNGRDGASLLWERKWGKCVKPELTSTGEA